MSKKASPTHGESKTGAQSKHGKDSQKVSESSMIKFDTIKLPSAAALQSKISGKEEGSQVLSKENLVKFEETSGLARKQRRRDSGENLSEITLSEQDIETQDKIFGQYIRVNRTKQRYRCEFCDVILHVEGTDYIIKKLNAEITS